MTSPLRYLSAFVLLALFLNPVTSAIQEVIRPVSPNPESPQTDLKHVSLLLKNDGTLEEIGYTRLPLKVLNEGSLQESQLARFKRWDTFDVINNDLYASLSLFDLGSVGLVRGSFFDFNTGKSQVVSKTLEKEQIPKLSHTSYRYSNTTTDDVEFVDNELTIKTESAQVNPQSRISTRRVKGVSGTQDFDIDYTVTASADMEGLGLITPLDSTSRLFFYELNSGNLAAEGSVKADGKLYTFDSETTSAGHHYGRGAFADRNYILRARGQGFLSNGKRLSLFLNGGYGNQETATATGHGFSVDKFFMKLNAVDVQINDNDLSQPIKFKTLFNSKKNFKECDVTFTPAHVEKQTVGDDKVNLETNLLVGRFSGYVTDYRNRKHTFNDLEGAVEITKLALQE